MALRAPDWAEVESAALRPVSHCRTPKAAPASASPALMASPSVLAHHRERALSRLRENVRQAKLHGCGYHRLDVIVSAVLTGDLSPREANAEVLTIRSRQEQRRAA